MTSAVPTAGYATAQRFVCPDGHTDPRYTKYPLEMIVPDGSGLTPACPQCRRPMTPAGPRLNGLWELCECCQSRDAATCTSCFGTNSRSQCGLCYLTNCPGIHKQCLECDGSRRVDCPLCHGDAVLPLDPHSERTKRCPACRKGRVTCPVCNGKGKPATAPFELPPPWRQLPGQALPTHPDDRGACFVHVREPTGDLVRTEVGQPVLVRVWSVDGGQLNLRDGTNGAHLNVAATDVVLVTIQDNTTTAATPQDAAQPSGDTPNGGSEMAVSMEINNIDEARNAATAESQELITFSGHVEIFINGLIAGGINRDAALMAKVREADEETKAAAAHWSGLVDQLNTHRDGEEYAKSGRAATTEYLKGGSNTASS